MNVKIIGIAGLILITVSLFTPIAEISQTSVTLLPIFDNYEIGNYWEWLDISAFALTMVITLFINLYLYIKKSFIGLAIIAAVQFASFFFVLTALWITSMKISDFQDARFAYSFGLLILLLGICANAATSILIWKKKVKTKAL